MSKFRKNEVSVRAVMRPFRGLFSGMVALLAGRLLLGVIVEDEVGLPLVGRVFMAVIAGASLVMFVNICLMSFCGRILVSINRDLARIRFGLRSEMFRVARGDTFAVEPSFGSLKGTGRYERWSIVQRQPNDGTAIIFSFIDKRDAEATLKALTSCQARQPGSSGISVGEG